VLDVTLAEVEQLDLAFVDVIAEAGVTRPAKSLHERQAHVPQTHDAQARTAILDSLEQVSVSQNSFPPRQSIAEPT
jgi:hypothetical protein